MLSRAGAYRGMSMLVAKAGVFRRDHRGIAAIEFALIAPLLLGMYFVTMEVSQAIETNKKVGRVANIVADLVTQERAVTPDDLDGMMKVASTSLMPYNRSSPSVTITAINITGGVAKIYWSRKLINGVASTGAAKGDVVTVPATYSASDNFLVRVDVQLGYRPVITWSAGGKETLGLTAAFDSIAMSETSYYYPRYVQQKIECSNCYGSS